MALESATYINGLVVSNPAVSDSVGQADDHIRMIKAVLKNTFPNINAPVTSTPLQLNQGPVPIGVIALWSGNPASLPTNWRLCDGSTVAKSDGSGNITLPDLRDKFVKGCGGSNSSPSATPTVGTTGGAKTHTHTVTNAGVALTKAMLPDYNLLVTEAAHTHTITDPGHTHYAGQNAVGGGAVAGPNYINSLNWNTTPQTSGANTTKVTNQTTGITLGSSKTNLTVALDGGGATHTHTATVNTPNHEPPYYTLAYIMKV